MLAFIYFSSADLIDELKSSYGSSQEIQEIINKLLQRSEDPKGYSLLQGLLLRKGKMVIVPTIGIHDKILHYIHTSPEAGHRGYQKILSMVKLNLYWSGMRRDIKRVVRECQICH